MPLDFQAMSNPRILLEMGERIERERLNRNMTQRELAELSGVGLRTIKNVEAGKGASLTTWISLLRGLQMLGRLEQLIPEPPLSPIQLAKLKGKQRQRATGNRKKKTADRVAEKPAKRNWTWGD